MNAKLNDEYINLVKMQRPYVEGNTNEEMFACYMQDVEQDYKDIREFLNHTTNLVDLGSGMGGIDFMIKRLHPNIHITLLDGEQVEAGEHYGYKEDLKFYSNNAVAKQFFDDNELAVDFYLAQDDLVLPCDTLISLNSWGFHYPINRYINFVKNNRPKIIILDIRSSRQNLNELQALGYVYHATLRTWGSKKSRTVLFDPLTHVGPTPT
jgi:hypothetical protein